MSLKLERGSLIVSCQTHGPSPLAGPGPSGAAGWLPPGTAPQGERSVSSIISRAIVTASAKPSASCVSHRQLGKASAGAGASARGRRRFVRSWDACWANGFAVTMYQEGGSVESSES